MKEDDITRIFKRAIDVLFISNPQGTALGVLLGLIIDTFINVFSPSLPTDIINKTFIESWRFTAGLCGLGVFSLNLLPYYKRNKIDPKIIEALNLIEQQKKEGHINKAQAKLAYTALVNEVVKNAVFKPEIQTQMRQIQLQQDEND